jgi:hypothetical protein
VITVVVVVMVVIVVVVVMVVKLVKGANYVDSQTVMFYILLSHFLSLTSKYSQLLVVRHVPSSRAIIRVRAPSVTMITHEVFIVFSSLESLNHYTLSITVLPSERETTLHFDVKQRVTFCYILLFKFLFRIHKVKDSEAIASTMPCYPKHRSIYEI